TDYKQTVDVQIITFLRNKHRLIVLDNFETVINGASFVRTILNACDGIKIIATSQQPLADVDDKLSGLEQSRMLAPLSYPEASNRNRPVKASEFAAVKLFIAHAKPTGALKLNAKNEEAIAAICRKVNGLPLCIRILASLIPTYGPQQLLKLLREHGFAKLDGKQRLSRTIEIRHANLDPEEQTLFRRLAIFGGWCSFDAVDKICQSIGGKLVDIITTLPKLVNKSFVQSESGGYQMLQVIRDFAGERLEASGEAALLRSEYANYYLQLAQDAEPNLKTPSRKKHLSSLEKEYDNFRAVFDWSIEPEGHLEIGLSLAGALFWYWDFMAYFQEGQRQVKRLLNLATFKESPQALASALYCNGGLSFLLGEYPYAEDQLTKSVELWRNVGDQSALAYALIILGMVKKEIGKNLAAARDDEEESVRLLEGRNEWGHALALNDLGNVMVAQGESYYDEARESYETSLSKWEQLQESWGRSLTLSNLSSLDCKEGRYNEAYELMQKALDVQVENNDKWGRAWSFKGIGEAKFGLKDYAAAAFNFYESFCLHSDLGRKQLVAECLEGLAKVAAGLNQTKHGAILIGAAQKLRCEAGTYAKGKEYEALLNNLRADLNEKEFKNAKATGVGLTQEQLQQLVNSFFKEWNNSQIKTMHMRGSAR
ncbi:MAG TPA: tetratricopeptide repeat protein, partial [Pyrinomonadaceae bacterium]|nr:tetratricopeptide repeat protein [Pyrinomonadaceae bacterium]